MSVTLLRTGCNQYTLVTGNTGTSYTLTITNINGKYTQSWTVVDNANVNITFSQDGIYILTSDNPYLFCGVTIAIAGGGVGYVNVIWQLDGTHLAPAYTGYVVTITLNGLFTLNYTIQATDTTVLTLTQSLINAINNLGISGVSAVLNGTELDVYVTPTITVTPTLTITNPDCAVNLWSTCNLWNCITYLIKKIMCCARRKCEEHTKAMQWERAELNRIMLLYTQFSMMNDDEQWDYLPLSENTDILNDIFDKLNCITNRCGHCCEEHERHHEHNEGCNECNQQPPKPVTDFCAEPATEFINITGPNVTSIPST